MLLTHHYWKYQNLRSLCVKFPKFGMGLHDASRWEKGMQLSPNQKKLGKPWYLLQKRYVLGSEIVIKSKNSFSFLVYAFFPQNPRCIDFLSVRICLVLSHYSHYFDLAPLRKSFKALSFTGRLWTLTIISLVIGGATLSVFCVLFIFFF